MTSNHPVPGPGHGARDVSTQPNSISTSRRPATDNRVGSHHGLGLFSSPATAGSVSLDCTAVPDPAPTAMSLAALSARGLRWQWQHESEVRPTLIATPDPDALPCSAPGGASCVGGNDASSAGRLQDRRRRLLRSLRDTLLALEDEDDDDDDDDYEPDRCGDRGEDDDDDDENDTGRPSSCYMARQ
jgi:hypothetical protein